MRKPKTLTHTVKRCDGSIAQWTDRWVREPQTCGECGSHQGYEWVNEGAGPNFHAGPFARVAGKSGQACEWCQAYIPSFAEDLAGIYTPEKFMVHLDKESGFYRMVRGKPKPTPTP